VWKQVYDDAVVPYTQHKIGVDQACKAGVAPIRKFMSMQIENTHNTEDVVAVHELPAASGTPASYDDVRLQALLPAFMLSELKTAFLIGFQIYLPFLILDMVVASVMVSMACLWCRGVGLVAVQSVAVRAGRWLASGGGNVDAEFSTVYVRRKDWD